MIDRRRLLVVAGGAAVFAPKQLRAQLPKRLPVVAVVFVGTPLAELAGPNPAFSVARAFAHELRDLGWIDGRTVDIQWRSADRNPGRAPEVFGELVARGVDVIVLGGARWLHDAALQATRAIPIVTIFQDDPVAAGLLKSLARPGGNLTGIAQTTGPEFFAKRLQLLLEVAPHITRVAFLGPRGVLDQDRDVGRPVGVAVIPIALDAGSQFEEAFAAILRLGADALMVAGSAVTFGNFARVVRFETERRLPTMHAFREAVDVGGLISYGPNVQGNFRLIARLADKFLKGARIGDVPAEEPTKFELIVNLKTAKSLGLALPQDILVRADEVIE